MSDRSESVDEVELIGLSSEELDELHAEMHGVDLVALAEQDDMELDEEDDDPGSLVDFVVPDNEPLCDGSDEFAPEETSASESFESEEEEESA